MKDKDAPVMTASPGIALVLSSGGDVGALGGSCGLGVSVEGSGGWGRLRPVMLGGGDGDEYSDPELVRAGCGKGVEKLEKAEDGPTVDEGVRLIGTGVRRPDVRPVPSRFESSSSKSRAA